MLALDITSRLGFVDYTEFKFDAVLSEKATQADVYEVAAQPIVLVSFTPFSLLILILCSFSAISLTVFSAHIGRVRRLQWHNHGIWTNWSWEDIYTFWCRNQWRKWIKDWRCTSKIVSLCLNSMWKVASHSVILSFSNFIHCFVEALYNLFISDVKMTIVVGGQRFKQL